MYYEAFHDALIPPSEHVARNHSALITRARKSKEDAARLRILGNLIFVTGLVTAGTYHYYSNSSNRKPEVEKTHTQPTTSAPTASANISAPNPQVFPNSEVQSASDRLTVYCSKNAKTETALRNCLNAPLPGVKRANNLCPADSSLIPPYTQLILCPFTRCSSTVPPYDAKSTECYLNKAKADEAVCERLPKSSICAKR